jgi:hypothetical protein
LRIGTIGLYSPIGDRAIGQVLSRGRIYSGQV